MSPEEVNSIRGSRDKLAAEINEMDESHKMRMAAKREILKAYNLVLKHAESNGASPPESGPAERLRVFSPGSYGYNTAVVQDSIRRLNGPFIVRDVLNELSERNINLDVTSISTVINRLREASNPTIRIKVPGRGRRPTIYERV